MIGFEGAVAVTLSGLAGLALAQARATRPAGDTALLVALALGFGLLFPIGNIQLLGHYRFETAWPVLGIPPYLPFAWFGLFSLALGLAEGLGRGPLATSLWTGAFLGLLEIEWDLVLLDRGLLVRNLPGTQDFFLGYTPGLALGHAYFGFAYAYAFQALRGSRRPRLAALIGALSLPAWPLAFMATLPLFEPLRGAATGGLSGPGKLLSNLGAFSVAFALAGLAMAAWLRFVARRLNRGGPA